MAITENKESILELPKVDWLDRESNPNRFFKDLSYALSEYGFMVLTNAPGLSDEFQQQAFREVRGFFDAPMDLKKLRIFPILHISVATAYQLQPIEAMDRS